MEILQETMVFSSIFMYVYASSPVWWFLSVSRRSSLQLQRIQRNVLRYPRRNLPGGVCLTHQPEERS